MKLEEFLKSKVVRNAWLELDEPMNLYARRATRVVDNEIVKTFDIASVEVETPGIGTFTKFLSLLEGKMTDNGFEGIFVESILNPDFAKSLAKRGYEKVSGDELCLNMFKSANKMQMVEQIPIALTAAAQNVQSRPARKSR